MDNGCDAFLRMPPVCASELMLIAVIGTGIIGVTTAYELACNVHQSAYWNAAGLLPRKPVLPTPGWSHRDTSRPGQPPGCPARSWDIY